MRILKLNEFERFTNKGLGTCHILKKYKNNLFLIYIENNAEHFCVVQDIKEDGAWTTIAYCKTLEESLVCFNEQMEME